MSSSSSPEEKDVADSATRFFDHDPVVDGEKRPGAVPPTWIGFIARAPLRSFLIVVLLFIGLYLAGLRFPSIVRVFYPCVSRSVHAQLSLVDLEAAPGDSPDKPVDVVEIRGNRSRLTNANRLNHIFADIQCGIVFKLDNGDALESLHALESAKVLELHVINSIRLTELWQPGALPDVRVVDLSRAITLRRLHGCSELPRLKRLTAESCAKLNDITGLVDLPELNSLDLSQCATLTNVRVGGDLPALGRLELRGCIQLNSLAGLAQMPRLDYLDISGCDSLLSLATLPALTRLRTLVICDNKRLGDVKALSFLPGLRTVYVGTNSNLARAARASLPADVAVKESCPE